MSLGERKDLAVTPSAMSLEDIRKYPICSFPIYDTNLSIRLRNGYTNGGIKFFGELIAFSESDFTRIKATGRATIKELKTFLAQHQLQLGTKIPGVAFKAFLQDCEAFIALRQELVRLHNIREQKLPALLRGDVDLTQFNSLWKAEGIVQVGLDAAKQAKTECAFQKIWLEAAKELVTPESIQELPDARSREIITSRIQNTPVSSLAERFGITSKAICQLEYKATRKLRSELRMRAYSNLSVV